MNTPATIDEAQFSRWEASGHLRQATVHAALQLAGLAGYSLESERPTLRSITLTDIAQLAGTLEHEMVGVYLLVQGDMAGQVLLLLTPDDAFALVDQLLGMPPGTTRSPDDLGRSALAEVGNQMISSFLNELSRLVGIEARPTPPAVVVDMLGSIMNVVVTTAAMMGDSFLVSETYFRERDSGLSVRLWIMPDPLGLALRTGGYL